ncbi:hypothetical protein LEMLEM_LOCUS19824 [Lemmus lemmus]
MPTQEQYVQDPSPSGLLEAAGGISYSGPEKEQSSRSLIKTS